VNRWQQLLHQQLVLLVLLLIDFIAQCSTSGTLKMREWKTLEETAWVDNAGEPNMKIM